jgi:type II secretory pathway pseudopilin PulG
MANRSPISSGFTYVGLLIVVAILAFAVTATIQLGAVVQRRDAERELLCAGSQFQLALRSYRDASPAGARPFPTELAQLLRDPRFPSLRRHLRAIPIDPMMGNTNWGIIRSPEGGIIGVHSLSDARPIKVGNFEPEFAPFTGKEKVSEWLFCVSPGCSVSLPERPHAHTHVHLDSPDGGARARRIAYRLEAGASSSRAPRFSIWLKDQVHGYSQGLGNSLLRLHRLLGHQCLWSRWRHSGTRFDASSNAFPHRSLPDSDRPSSRSGPWEDVRCTQPGRRGRAERRHDPYRRRRLPRRRCELACRRSRDLRDRRESAAVRRWQEC